MSLGNLDLFVDVTCFAKVEGADFVSVHLRKVSFAGPISPLSSTEPTISIVILEVLLDGLMGSSFSDLGFGLALGLALRRLSCRRISLVSSLNSSVEDFDNPSFVVEVS